LNAALLKARFGIDWEIPIDNLFPAIPGRLDYMLYIADLYQKKEINLLDIGTGASLIYPILANCHFNWQCTASEVNNDSLVHAKSILEKNPKLKNIELRSQKFKSHIFDYLLQPDDCFDAVVCNPPFFKNSSEAQRKVKNLKLQGKENLNFGGVINELWYKNSTMLSENQLFFDFLLTHRSKKGNAEFYLHGKNLLNKSQFVQIQNTEFSETIFSSSLFERFVIIGMNHKF